MNLSQLFGGFDDTVWTDARAAALDNLDVALTAQQGRVKSIQTGIFSQIYSAPVSYLDVTISTVNPAKCVTFVQGLTALENSYFQATVSTADSLGLPYISSLSSTNIRIQSAGGPGGMVGRWTVVEYY